MKIKFTQDVELEVIEGFDEETEQITDSCFEKFRKGEEIELDIIDDNDDRSICTFQFFDGSCAYCVQKAWFDVLEKDDDEEFEPFKQ